MGVSVLVCVMLAVWCAEYDAARIIRGKVIHHALWWTIRAVVVSVTCIGSGVPLMAIECAGLFSALFRWELNDLRGLTWWYISRSNLYDRAWIKIGGSVKAGGIAATCAEYSVFMAVVVYYLMR